MHEVKVNKYDLLVKLKENRDNHKQAYEEAIAGYKEQLRKVYLEKIAALDDDKIPEQSPNLPKPSNHTQDYDHIIEMVAMSVENELKLSSQEFAMYVMDNWGWKQNFTQTTSNYR